MKNIFMSILREIKGNIDTKQMTSPNINTEMFQNILASAKETSSATMDDVMEIVTSQMSQLVDMDDEAKELFKNLFVKMAGQEESN